MTATIRKNAHNLREVIAQVMGIEKRMPQQLVRIDFTSLIDNGGFDTGLAGATVGNGASVSNVSGALRLNNQAGTSGFPYAQFSFASVAGRSYAVSASALAPAYNWYNQINLSLGEVATASDTNSGVKTVIAKATGDTLRPRLFHRGSAVGNYVDFDNLSAWEADPDDDAPWLRLPYGYDVGQRGMIVRDGLILHPSDYKEITREGQTWIKPTVSPGHDTEFSVWAGVKA